MLQNSELKSKLFDRMRGKLDHWENAEAMARDCLDALETSDAHVERLTILLAHEQRVRRRFEMKARCLRAAS